VESVDALEINTVPNTGSANVVLTLKDNPSFILEFGH